MKVSIIIPVYNVERYIIRCLESVKQQAYQDLEVILIDDCGNDNSIALAEQYIIENGLSAKFTIIRHSHNMGLSEARNTGIRACTGKYLFFLDSDDEISPDCINLLSTSAFQTNADFCIGRIAYVSPDKIIDNKHNLNQPSKTLSQHEAISMYLADKLPWNAVNRLIRRDFITSNNIYFTKGVTSEDLLWNFQTLQFISHAVAINDITYFYHANPNSIMSSASTNEKFANDLLKIGNIMNDIVVTANGQPPLLLKYYIHLRYSFIPYALIWHKYPNKLVQENLHNRFEHYVHLPISRKIIFLFPAKIIAILERGIFISREYLQLLKIKLTNAHT